MRVTLFLLLCLSCYSLNASIKESAETISEDAETAQASATTQIAFKKEKEISSSRITTSYVLLVVVLIVVIAALSYIRRRLNQGWAIGSTLKSIQGDQKNRLNLLERKRIGGQTHASLLAVDDQLLVIVESNNGVAIRELTQSVDNSKQPLP